MKVDIRGLDKEQLSEVIRDNFICPDPELFAKADEVRQKHYGKKVFVRGLIEFTNYCQNDCYYCGIRCGNRNIRRYRLSKGQILACAETGYALGFRTFVLQGGEDPYFTDERVTDIVRVLKQRYPDCAVTLSIGEKSAETYRKYYEAGADRYLLRHETADEALYGRLHPHTLSLARRKACLYSLKEIGFETGAGFMVGPPGQTISHLAEDLLFLKELEPHMVGIGPFIPHKDTPYAAEKPGTMEQTRVMLALTRLMLPEVLLPATTALATIHPEGREKGLQAGANVVMPNLSPVEVRDDYMLYDNKINTGDEAAQSILHLQERIEKAGYEMDFSIGSHVRRKDST